MNEDKAQTTVLVTGASGYIAMHCILQLLQQGYQVRGTLRTPALEEELRQTFARHVDADDRLEFVTAYLLDDAGWAEAADGCRYVLHIASPNELDEPKEEDAWVAPARDGTLRVLGAAADAGVERTDASSERLKSTLGWQPRPVKESIIDTAESLIEFDLV
jgi:dihydroflavonol-4-reductase